jgi:hypothetical protein
MLTGKIGYRTSILGKQILRVEAEIKDYITTKIIWRDATINDMNNLLLSATLKKRP